MIVYVSIGNSDDKLSQAEWAQFQEETQNILFGIAVLGGDRSQIHGRWASLPTEPWQNAAWCIDLGDYDSEELKTRLRTLATKYNQDAIAWAEVNDTEFLGGQ